MAFSGGLVGGGDVNTTPSGGAATSGANGTVQQVLNQSRNVSLQNTTEVVGARNNTTARNTTATLNATPTRTVDPNSTPWNGAIGAGIYHTEGGTHYVGPSDEIALKQREAKMTPTPASLTGWGEGSGHATGPLSWVGTGNWSPGFIDLPAGDAQVVLLSQGTTAFILADESDTRAGFGVFLPPGGTYTVPVPQAGRYVIAFGTANKTDSWSATVLLPGERAGRGAARPDAEYADLHLRRERRGLAGLVQPHARDGARGAHGGPDDDGLHQGPVGRDALDGRGRAVRRRVDGASSPRPGRTASMSTGRARGPRS